LRPINSAPPAWLLVFAGNEEQAMDKIDFMNGQIKALLNFATAVIKAHPSPEILRHHFEQVARADPTSPEGLSISEAYVDGIADIDRQLAVALEQVVRNAQRREANPD